MKNFFKAVVVDIAIILDAIKGFVITTLVIAAIIISLSAVIHNVFKIREIYSEDKTGYKNLVTVDDNRLNLKVFGEGEKTIVILSSFANPSPIVQYKPYTERLVENGYKVVVIEYFGYGYSLSTKSTRNVGYFIHEINEALTSAEIFEKCTFLANGVSGIYASAYANTFPDSVEKLILVDSIYPATINEEFISKQIENQKLNIVLTHYAEATGYARILSYVYPKAFSIDKMEELGFAPIDIKVYRKMIANRFYTGAMKNEYKLLSENMEQFKNYKFPDYLPTLQILSNGYVEEYENYKANNQIKNGIKDYAEGLITNQDIQKVVVVDGERENLNLTNPDAVISQIIND